MGAPALFGVGATSVPGITAGSSFLTGPVAGGIAAGATNAFGQALQSKSVNFRGKYARNQLKHQQKIWKSQRDQMGPDMRSRVNAVKSAGLHPLAALGITPSASGPESQPMLPGQSPNYGSAISEGIQTAQNLAIGNQRGTQSRVIAGLQVQEQQLRNDFLAEQIKSSRMKRLTDLANSMRPPVNLRPHPTEGEKRTMLSRSGGSYTTGPGTPYQVLENDLGEGAQIMPSMILNLWDAFWADLANVNKPATTKLNKHLQNRRKIYKKQFLNPTPYKGMGKTHY